MARGKMGAEGPKQSKPSGVKPLTAYIGGKHTGRAVTTRRKESAADRLKKASKARRVSGMGSEGPKRSMPRKKK